MYNSHERVLAVIPRWLSIAVFVMMILAGIMTKSATDGQRGKFGPMYNACFNVLV